LDEGARGKWGQGGRGYCLFSTKLGEGFLHSERLVTQYEEENAI